MLIRDKLLMQFGPGGFSGVTLPIWLRVLRENQFRIDPSYWPRAAIISLASIPNTFAHFCESLLYDRRIEDTPIQPPLFVLGIWRSGTTHLHNLLAVDNRFAFPNLYQVLNPWTFLLTERTNATLANLFLPKTRPQDNVKFAISEPQEEEFALCSLIGRSLLMSMAFPRNAEFHDRYLMLRDVSPKELHQWKSALVWFLKKLTFKYGRALVLKSPGHTCRIKLLVEMFPDAKFVHIRRNPYDVFQSALHTLQKAGPWWRMQRSLDEDMLAGQVLRQYEQIYDAYFAERTLIPDGRLHEITFEDLEREPVVQIKEIYKALDLPSFEYVETRLNAYVDSLVGYRKNEFPPLSPELRQKVQSKCQRCFHAWGYKP